MLIALCLLGVIAGGALAREIQPVDDEDFVTTFYDLCEAGEDVARCVGAWSKSNTENGECFTYRNCSKAAAVEYTDSGIVFHLIAHDAAAEYISLGFSLDQSMGNDSVVSCVPGDETSPLKAALSYNIGTKNAKAESDEGVSLLYSNIQDSDRYCKFTLKDTLEYARTAGDKAAEEFYLLAVAGTMRGDNVGHHYGRAYSVEPWNFSSGSISLISFTLLLSSITTLLIK